MADEIKILCVDDEKNVLKSLRRTLVEEGYDIRLAQSGEEGLAILEQEPDMQVVMSDYRMPAMNGVEFLRQVRDQWPDTIRIIISGYVDATAMVEAINEGHIYKFLPKPWDDDQLKSVLATAIDVYKLKKNNALLSESLQEAVHELEVLNRDLELLVEERTGELQFRNKALQREQFILDVLPVGVLGLDRDGLIVQCNQMGAQLLFSRETAPPIGQDIKQVLSSDIREFVRQTREKHQWAGSVLHDDRSLCLKGSVISDRNGMEGIIIVVDCPQGD